MSSEMNCLPLGASRTVKNLSNSPKGEDDRTNISMTNPQNQNAILRNRRRVLL